MDNKVICIYCHGDAYRLWPKDYRCHNCRMKFTAKQWRDNNLLETEHRKLAEWQQQSAETQKQLNNSK